MAIALDIVVVTFNRLQRLKKALANYDNQTSTFRNLIIVDNCSTDGTDEYLKEWAKVKTNYSKIIITAQTNSGGSGGFYLGQKKAISLNADWVLVADDDAYADNRLVEFFYNFIDNNNYGKLSAVCSTVLSADGSICLYHRDFWSLRNGLFFERRSSTLDDYQKDSFPIDFMTYVGTFINVQAMKSVGTVNPRFFIYFDDSEHCFRLKRYGEIVCVPELKMTHDCVSASNTVQNSHWKDYYYFRNEFYMLLKHMKLAVSLRMIKRFIVKYGKDISKDPKYLKLYRVAIWHAIFGIMGKNKHYLPSVK